ncbi:MAG: hypothetical protein C5B50_06395 [Verrucomicrobia bacterium]|nr:MAG: hypothetical protein C5B50_06395 [Verrucomicrobiota bacterium]
MAQESATLKSEVKEFWNRQSCDTHHAESRKFSREYFEEIEQWRYADQPFVHAFAQFTRYRGKRILEVGFGAGTDFIQWLRAGAVASGIDLTEEALENLRHRIEVYGFPQPAFLAVSDAEKLPFEPNTFDLGYSWGVLHHTPNTEKAVAEVVRVVRPGGEIKLMLYNRRSLCLWRCWLKNAALKGRPWKSLRWACWNHIESIGTKAYTRREILQMLEPLGVTNIRIQTFLTSADRIEGKTTFHRLANTALGLVVALTGTRMGWFHCISATKA